MENKHRPKRAAGQLATDSARETGSGESKLIESLQGCNLFQGMTKREFERHVREISNCFPPRHRSMLDKIELAPIECPKCRRILITGSIKGLPQTFHGCKCMLIVHLMRGHSIPRHAADWSAHLLAQAADYAKEAAPHEHN